MNWFSPASVRMMKQKKSAGLIIGSVMSLNCRHEPAPSIDAASYRCRGTP